MRLSADRCRKEKSAEQKANMSESRVKANLEFESHSLRHLSYPLEKSMG
jgi:hypothetical protein